MTTETQRCPVAKMRPELKELPDHMKHLPLDKRGYPIPFFVDYLPDGEPEFRAMDPRKYRACITERRCWVCGGKLGAYLCFVIGPMCGINRTTAEPPSHYDCGMWSAVNCPFLSRPHMDRRENGLPEGIRDTMPGVAILRNPGVTLLWTTKSYKMFSDGRGGMLIEIGEPLAVEFYASGRPALRSEIQHSVETGLPFLLQEAVKQPGDVEELYKRRDEFEAMYPEA